jgi:SAM-dependent methyltransferase
MRAGTIYRNRLFDGLGVRAHGDRVLDIGTFDSFWLSGQAGRLRVGLDLEVRNNPDCASVRGDALNLPFPSQSFDSVFAFEVIEHVPDAQRFIEEIVRVTRPGGEITISTPNADMRIFPGFLTPWAHRRWGHDACTGFAPDALQALFSRAGAAEVTVTELRTATLRALYLPMTLVGRLSSSHAAALFRTCGAIDSRWRHLGKRGYVLATVRR